MDKVCPEHGHSTFIVENSADFYHNQIYSNENMFGMLDGIIFDVTNRCNLNCPHCYQIPDSKSIDKTDEQIILEIEEELTVDGTFSLNFAGAEPTLRMGLAGLLKKLHEKFGKETSLMTNGIKFANASYLKNLVASGGFRKPSIGLNHWSYQGETVHKKQLIGIDNLHKLGIVPVIGYTLESYDHLYDVIPEAVRLYKEGKAKFVRIRLGSDIGRTPDEPFKTLSDNVARVKQVCDELGYGFELLAADNNIYHQMVNINGLEVRVIQWPDATNILLSELQTGPYAKFYDGPVSNFVHQVILRDAFINMKLPKLDSVPIQYTRNQIVLQSP
jgi:organic radical activating enzyme